MLFKIKNTKVNKTEINLEGLSHVMAQWFGSLSHPQPLGDGVPGIRGFPSEQQLAGKVTLDRLPPFLY